MVLDSSVLLAYLLNEPGAERAEKALLKGGLLLSSVNRTEIKGRLVGMGLATPQAVDIEFQNLAQLVEIVAFDLEQSDLAAYYYARRNPYNLSLGDCACLALAEARGLPVLTAEQSWAKLPSLPVKVHLIR
ncbi:MAG: type II toxin-antitoxin system VapC family toxin [Pleurocapsa sp. SU_196_0]|nr:type II toxin-antitoxin system VapC family toxin [Pleurocapsa sp. SU_196_0]